MTGDTFPTIPGYQILKQMGQGGMASVYLAVQESFGRQVALKIMSDQLGKDDVWAKRFMHEARIVAQLSHSNIVPVFDVGSHDGRFYISMELLKGGKLDERMAKGLSVPEVIRIICGVAAGLDYAGAKGFVHRDIKPDNIMFRDDGTPVILDFGIAKQKDGDSKMTKTGTIVGTTGYMSPEQAMGQELDERSDIYSLGIMMYELLTGYMPFRGDSAVAVLLKHVQEVPPPLPANLAIFQPAMDKALAKKPEDRYQRASEMIDHLQELLAFYKQQQPAGKNTATQSKAHASSATVVTSPVGAAAKTAVNASLQTRTPAATAPETTHRKKPVIVIAVVVIIVVVLLVLGKINHNRKQAAVDNASNPAPVTTLSAPTATAPMPAAATTTTPVAEPTRPEIPAKSEPPVPVAVTVPVKTVEPPAAVPEPATDDAASGNRRAVARILLGAHECMKNRQYDCAKSKAEAALDLDPENETAKRILANARKAQQEAFGGDWNAK